MSEARRLPKRRISSFKAGFLWGLVISVSVGTFAVASDSPPSSTVVYGGVGGLLALYCVVQVMLDTRQMRRFAAENNAAIAMLVRGEHQRAHAVFWAWAERTRMPYVNAVARYNVATVLVHRGELEHAIETYIDSEVHFEKALKRAALYRTSAVEIAYAYALLGNTDKATEWLKHADDRKNAHPTMPSFVAQNVSARALLECRSGRPAEAARLLDDSWNECEALLAGASLRSLRVIRAFAQATADVRNAGVAERTLSDMRPAYDGEFDFLGVAWPEMAAFLAAHQLTKRA